MGLVQTARPCLHHYATFEGRSARPAFSWWVLFSFLFNIVVSGLTILIRLMPHLLGSLVGLALLLPSLAVRARRLRNSGRSSSWKGAVYTPHSG